MSLSSRVSIVAAKPAAAQAPGADRGGSRGAVDLSVRPGSVKNARVTATGAVQTLPPSPQARQTAQTNTYGSIRSFGGEAEGEEATAITFALVQYLDVKASGDWETACARVYSPLRETLQGADGSGACPRALGALEAYALTPDQVG